MLCGCGKTWETRRERAIKSSANCGCRGKRNLKHGYAVRGSKLRLLLQQWYGMFQRARKREDCEVVGSWVHFENFKNDALEAGWTLENRLWVCRKEDKGNYCKENVYFGNRSDNIRDTWKYGGRSSAKPNRVGS